MKLVTLEKLVNLTNGPYLCPGGAREKKLAELSMGLFRKELDKQLHCRWRRRMKRLGEMLIRWSEA